MERWRNVEKKPAPVFIPAYGPLSGLRILLNGSVAAAPFAATMLSDFGAEVIQIELPRWGDALRTQRPGITDGDKDVSCTWAQNARNRLSFTLNTNLKIPESKEIFLSLIKNSDVWIENLVWLEKLGISDELLMEVNPKLIIAHISGYGRPQFGGLPEVCDQGGYDPVAQAESGYLLLNGYPDRPPVWATQFMTDYTTGLYIALGIMMALHHAERTGKGQSIDISMVEAIMRQMDDCFSAWLNSGLLKSRFGCKLPVFQPAELFTCQDGRWINIGAFGPIVYDRALRAFGLDPGEFPYLECGASPQAVASPKGVELSRRTAAFAARHTADELKQIMIKAKVPAGIVKSVDEVCNDPHWQQRNTFIQVKDETLARDIKIMGVKPILSETPGAVWRGAPRLGQDTEMILRDLLGYSAGEIEALKGRNLID